jgi:hypothetical protein
MSFLPVLLELKRLLTAEHSSEKYFLTECLLFVSKQE